MADELAEGMIDGRCFCQRCEDRTQDVYRMVSGRCSNCHAGPFLMVFRGGDPATSRDCPACGNRHTLTPKRRATPDEIPTAVSS